MSPALILGLVVALLGVPGLLLLAWRAQQNALRPAFRASQWALASCVVACAILGTPSWRTDLGVRSIGIGTLTSALLAAGVVILAWPALRLVRSAGGGGAVEQSPQFTAIANLSFRYRVFLVLTAAMVEETLYRGYAIGIGAQVLGSVAAAATLSLAVFTLSHIRWGLSHLLSVAWAASILTLLFVTTGDLLACVVAHALIDTVGLLIAPSFLARTAGRGTRDAGSCDD